MSLQFSDTTIVSLHMHLVHGYTGLQACSACTVCYYVGRRCIYKSE